MMMEEAAGIQSKICCFLAPVRANARHCLAWVARVVGVGGDLLHILSFISCVCRPGPSGTWQ